MAYVHTNIHTYVRTYIRTKRMERIHEGSNNNDILSQYTPQTEDEHQPNTQLHGNSNRSRENQIIPTYIDSKYLTIQDVHAIKMNKQIT